jgi:hypothetical protein
MKILFLRVGIDRGCGGTLSPIFADRSFEYVPIPEYKPVLPGRAVRYGDIAARCGGTLERFAAPNGAAHFDPEFETYTYGEPNHPKRSQLLALEAGDCLAFYAGFQGANVCAGTCFLFGYFKVAQVHIMPPGEEWPPSALAHLENNAHFRRANPEPSLVIVEGERHASKLLSHAVQLSDERQVVLPQLSNVLGFSGSVKRAVGRWVPQSHVASTADWIAKLQ